MRQQASINLVLVTQRNRPTHLLKFWLSGCHLVECVGLEVLGWTKWLVGRLVVNAPRLGAGALVRSNL